MVSSGRRSVSPTRAAMMSGRSRATTPDPAAMMDMTISRLGGGIFGQRMRSFDGSASNSPFQGSSSGQGGEIGLALASAGVSRPGVHRGMAGLSITDVSGGVSSTGAQAGVMTHRAWELKLAAEAETAAAVNGGPGALRPERSAPALGRPDVHAGTNKRQALIEARRRASMRVRGRVAGGRAGGGGSESREDREREDKEKEKQKDPLAFLPQGMARAALEEAGRKAKEQAKEREQQQLQGPRGFLTASDIAVIKQVLNRTVEAASLAAAASDMEELLPCALEDHIGACFDAEAAREEAEAAAKRQEEQKRKDMARIARKKVEERLSVRSKRMLQRTFTPTSTLVVRGPSGGRNPETWSNKLQGDFRDLSLSVTASALIPTTPPADEASEVSSLAEQQQQQQQDPPDSSMAGPQRPVDPKYVTVATAQDLNVLDPSEAQHYSRHFLTTHGGGLQTVGPSAASSSQPHQQHRSSVAARRTPYSSQHHHQVQQQPHSRPRSAITMSSGRVAASSRPAAGSPQHRQLGGRGVRLRALGQSSSPAIDGLSRSASRSLGRPQSALIRVIRDHPAGDAPGGANRPLMTINQRKVGPQVVRGSPSQQGGANSSSALRTSKSAGAALLGPALMEIELYQELQIIEDTDTAIDHFEGFLETCSSEAAIGGDCYDLRRTGASSPMPEYELEASQSCAAIMGGPVTGAALSSSSRRNSREKPREESGAKPSSRRGSMEKPREEDSFCAGATFMGSDSLILSSRKPLQGRPVSAKPAAPSLQASRGRARPGASAPRAFSSTRTPSAKGKKAAAPTGAASESAAGRRAASASSNQGTAPSNRKGPAKRPSQSNIEPTSRAASPAPAKGIAQNPSAQASSAEPTASRAASPGPALQRQSSILDNGAVHKRISRILRHQTETMDEERVRRYT